MAISFPGSPTLNQTYAYAGRSWIWNGSSWQAQGTAAITTRTVSDKSANYSLSSADENQIIRFTGSSAQIFTINNALNVGGVTSVFQDGTGTVNFSAGSGVTLLSPAGFSTRAQYSKVDVNCVASGQYRLSGDLPAISVVTGGTLSSDSTYYYRTFTASSSLSVSSLPIAVDILMVAGGGTGGAVATGQTQRGAGGGAGGLIYISSYTMPAGSYTIAVGSGGASASGTAVAKGVDTVLSGNGRTITALGGGSGGYNDTTNNATSGGSGAGQWYPGYPGSAATQPSTTSDGVGTYASTGFGNAGGTSGNSQPYASGGGGAGAAGGNYNAVGGPVGGAGKQYSAFATATTTGANSGYYAGGGGGAGYPPEGSTYANYAGGAGGGGTGVNTAYNAISNAVVNTGGGGGAGGSGGSGIVIIRYTKASVGG
jgi:hypothetical protein